MKYNNIQKNRQDHTGDRLVATVVAASAAVAVTVSAGVPAAASGRRVAAAVAAGAAGVVLIVAGVEAGVAPPLAEVDGEAAPATAAAAAATAASEDWQEKSGVAGRASSGPVAAGRGARLGALPLTTAVSRLWRRKRLPEASGHHFVNQGKRHSNVGCAGAVNGPPARVGGQNLRGGRPVLGHEEVAGRDDLAQWERTEPALNEAVKPA